MVSCLTLKCCVIFSPRSELLRLNMKFRLQLIRARPNFYMVSDNPSVIHGIVECWLYTRRTSFKDDYHSTKMDMLAQTPVNFIFFEILAKTFIIPGKQNHFIQKNNFNRAPVRRTAIALNRNSAFYKLYTEDPFWYQQFNVRQIRISRRCQQIVDCDAADNCRLYGLKMKARTFKMISPHLPSKTSMY